MHLISGGGMGGAGGVRREGNIKWGVSFSRGLRKEQSGGGASLCKGPGAAAGHQRSRHGAEVPREEG